GKPAKVFILIGINDISRNVPDTVIVANYKKIISRIKRESPQTKIYFNTLLPVNNTFPNRDNFTNKFQNILNVNEEIRKLATTEGITVIDIHPHFLDAENKLDKKYTYDGLHLDGDGYQKWASLLKPYLN
ncbi:MAG TPA: GDSL-type esterase/lipase family protein, partial [Chitinophagaceae bacterium]|nr:GDSL-type esterase/lipase family protein [Chitinophagaceae bacterium]